MTSATDTDIRELKDLILGLDKKTDVVFANMDKKIDVGFANMDKKIDVGFANMDKKIDVGFANVDTKLTKMEGRIDTLETRVLGKFETVNAKITNLETNTKAVGDLAEKVGELKNWKQIAIVVFTATVSGSIGYFVRSGKI